ncbi:MAG: hypothetical protein ACOX7O_10310 [Oscillospiraceae bacterium]|jgi:Tfp pilus assembly protein PilO
MNISKRDQRLLLILLGIAVFLASYLGTFRTYSEKKAEIQTQIEAITPRLTELRGYQSHLAEYQEGISKIQDSVSSELSKFPDDVRSEDMIMYVTKLEEKIGLNAKSISIVPPELISQFNVPKESSEKYELVPVAALRTCLSIDCSLNYDQLKKLIDYIYATPEKTALKSVSVSYNAETGGLTGNVIMEKYFVSSSDYAYKPTDIPPVAKGTNDPFGTFSVTVPPAEGEEN